MNELALRRVAGGPEPVREVVRWRAPGPMEVWRSHGSAVGRFLVDEALAERVLRAAADVAGMAESVPASEPVPGSSRVAEYLSVDGVSVALDGGDALTGPWGTLLEACRAALAEPGSPLAAVTVRGEPPSRVSLELLGEGALVLGFGALQAGLRWERNGVPVAYAETQLREAEVEAGEGWVRTLDLQAPPGGEPDGDPVSFASFAIFDEGVWFPVWVEGPVSR